MLSLRTSYSVVFAVILLFGTLQHAPLIVDAFGVLVTPKKLLNVIRSVATKDNLEKVRQDVT